MPARKKTAKAATKRATPAARTRDTASDVAYALGWLEKRGTKKNRDGMARYGIVAKKVFGVSMGTMKSLAKELGRDHALSQALWKTGWYEARMLASLVGEPDRVTPAQMERWAKAFDNWAVCDGVCCHLLIYTPFAWPTIPRWSRRQGEFVRRGAFSMLAGLAAHDRTADDGRFIEALPLIESAADDGRNFVKKAVNWALRSIGKRSPMLNKEAVAVARRLADADDSASRWVGKDALRELTSPAVQRRLAKPRAKKVA